MSARPPDLAEGGKGASRATLHCASALRCAKWDVSCDGGNALSCVALGEAMSLDWVQGDLAQLQAPQSGSAGGRGERERDMMMNGWCPQSTVVTCHPLINDDTCAAILKVYYFWKNTRTNATRDGAATAWQCVHHAPRPPVVLF